MMQTFKTETLSKPTTVCQTFSVSSECRDFSLVTHERSTCQWWSRTNKWILPPQHGLVYLDKMCAVEKTFKAIKSLYLKEDKWLKDIIC